MPAPVRAAASGPPIRNVPMPGSRKLLPTSARPTSAPTPAPETAPAVAPSSLRSPTPASSASVPAASVSFMATPR